MAGVSLLHSLGGCGGTLVAQCLGYSPRAVLLSETNPRSAGLFDGLMNPRVQLAQWYPDLAGAGGASAESLGDPAAFGAFVKRLHDAVTASGRYLVIRDYNYADYIGVPPASAAMNSSLLAALSGQVAFRSALVVRHPSAQLQSLRSHRTAAHLTGPSFVDAYLAFLDDFPNAYVVKYELFAANPFATMSLLCKYYRIPYDRDAVARHHENRLVTGNLRRAADSEIAAATDKHGAGENELAEVAGYSELLRRLGYAASVMA